MFENGFCLFLQFSKLNNLWRVEGKGGGELSIAGMQNKKCIIYSIKTIKSRFVYLIGGALSGPNFGASSIKHLTTKLDNFNLKRCY